MQEYKSIVSEQAEKLLSGLPARVSQVHGLVEKNFQIRQPSALTASYTQVIKTGGKYDTNDVLHGLVSLVGEEVHNTLEVLQKISAWILLLVPKIADGNNFGVEVQKAAYIHVKDSIEKWQKVWDGLTDYYNQRATAIEKIKDKISKEKSSSSTSTKTTGGKVSVSFKAICCCIPFVVIFFYAF
jgi:proteasome activator subunit 3 (PA28 gamma)